MNITITTRKQHPVSDEELYKLFLLSFQQWRDSSIDAPFMYHTFEEFQGYIKQAVIFLAVSSSLTSPLREEGKAATTNEVVGMHCFYCYKKKHYASGFYLAISPEVKHQGIASRLLAYEKEQFQARGYRSLRGTTSVPAIWSVRWHLKNGYRIIGYGKGCSPYSDSYSFRLQLAPFSWRHPSTWLWNKPLAPITARCCYLASYATTRLTHHRNGQLNWIGRVGRQLMVHGSLFESVALQSRLMV